MTDTKLTDFQLDVLQSSLGVILKGIKENEDQLQLINAHNLEKFLSHQVDHYETEIANLETMANQLADAINTLRKQEIVNSN